MHIESTRRRMFELASSRCIVRNILSITRISESNNVVVNFLYEMGYGLRPPVRCEPSANYFHHMYMYIAAAPSSIEIRKAWFQARTF